MRRAVFGSIDLAVAVVIFFVLYRLQHPVWGIIAAVVVFAVLIFVQFSGREQSARPVVKVHRGLSNSCPACLEERGGFSMKIYNTD